MFLNNFKILIEKKPPTFSKKTQILKVLRHITKTVAFYSNFDTVWWKIFSVRSVHEHHFSVNTVGRHRAKKRSIWRKDFDFHIINMTQNNNILNEIMFTKPIKYSDYRCYTKRFFARRRIAGHSINKLMWNRKKSTLITPHNSLKFLEWKKTIPDCYPRSRFQILLGQ